MTEPQDEVPSAALPNQPVPQAQPVISSAPMPVQPFSQGQGQGQDQLNRLISHPAVKGYLGKSIKIIAGFAVLGCLLLWGAITCLSNIICGALPK
jgi:hypothetical protein